MRNINVKNVLGCEIPAEINGNKTIPFQGVGVHRPIGTKQGAIIPTCIDYPESGNKIKQSLAEALKACGIADGMTISTHHHLRNGDLVTNQLFDTINNLNVKDIVWFPSAAFPCHEYLIKYINDGTISGIEGSVSGGLGKYISNGKMSKTAVLRSHGGRVQAIQDGDVKIDIAVIAAPSCDFYGNATGQRGQSACGVLGYAKADYLYADKVIVVTDNLVDFPCMPMEIEGSYVDFVVKIDKIGNADKIISNTSKTTKSPDKLLIAELTTKFLQQSGILYDGCFMQTGADGIGIAILDLINEYFQNRGWKSNLMYGGSTMQMAQMIKQGTLEVLLDGQVFDKEALQSIVKNSGHHQYPVFNAYNYHSKGNLSGMIDVAVLGIKEIDINFNGNVVTNSDGCLAYGLGGWQNSLIAKNVIIPVSLFRDRVTVIKNEVTAICGPGELIDVIVTERGIAINPKRTDLIDRMKGTDLPIKTIEELKAEAETICGIPQKPLFESDIVAAINWIDGTVIDVIRKIKQ